MHGDIKSSCRTKNIKIAGLTHHSYNSKTEHLQPNIFMFPAELMLFSWSGAGYPGGQAPDPGDGVQDAAARLPRRANHRAKLLQRQLERLVFSARLVGLILLLPC